MTIESNALVYNLLICSVGGTYEPIAQSLRHWLPARVHFVVSSQTRRHADAAIESYAKHEDRPLSPGCCDYTTVDDAEDFAKVVSALRPLAATVHDWKKRGDVYRVVVDFTGGTKCMSAALALVAHRWPCEFSYVGGARRSKDGVGVVESGSERVVLSANPWDSLGYQAVEDAVTVFNHGGYAAASGLLDRATRAADDPTVKRKLSTLKAVIDAYAEWDRFEHNKAKERFRDALKNQSDLGVIFADASPLISRLEHHLEQVAQLADQNDPMPATVEDLLQNTRRRAAERRFDDAVARLYRACEALAQVRLRECYGIADTKCVPLEKVPEALRSQWAARARNGAVMLGLREAYTLLDALGDDLGKRFADSNLADDQKSPMVARNQSILAHGFQPVGEKAYNQMYECLCSLTSFDDTGPHDWCLPTPS